jgi:hypothetical protein
MFKKWKSHRRYILLTLFAAIFILGARFTFDFGLSWDDFHNRRFGECAYHYIFTADRDTSCMSDEIHGVIHSPFFEVLLIAAEKASQLTDSQHVFFLRHFLTFFLFFIGLIVFYRFLRHFVEDWKWRALGVLAFIFSPRIFSDAFYNSVDIGAMVFLIFAMASMMTYLERPTSLRRAWIHGLICAAAIDTRLTSIFAPLFTLVALAFLLSKSANRRELIKAAVIYLGTLTGFTILFWPYLWTNPFAHFFHAIHRTAGFNNPADFYRPYLGLQDYRVPPWHYNFVWIAITTPIIFLGCAVVGFFESCRSLIGERWKVRGLSLLSLAWFFLPLLLAIVLQTSLYNGWRHHFFVYPALVILFLVGLKALMPFLRRWRLAKIIFIFAFAVELFDVAAFMIRNHPYHHVYFNRLISMEKARELFEMDYWGLSYREGYERLLHLDARPTLLIAVEDEPGVSSRSIVAENERARIQLVPSREADFLITHYPFTSNLLRHFPHEITNITVEGVPILTVRKR